MALDSSAFSIFAVSTSISALDRPTRRGRNHDTPQSGDTPTLVKIADIRVVVSPKRRSQAIA